MRLARVVLESQTQGPHLADMCRNSNLLLQLIEAKVFQAVKWRFALCGEIQACLLRKGHK